jgi:hypothetical protein
MSRRDSPASGSESEQDSASDSEVSETAVANHSSESEAEEDNGNLAAFYGKLDRVDDKDYLEYGATYLVSHWSDLLNQ